MPHFKRRQRFRKFRKYARKRRKYSRRKTGPGRFLVSLPMVQRRKMRLWTNTFTTLVSAGNYVSLEFNANNAFEPLPGDPAQLRGWDQMVAMGYDVWRVYRSQLLITCFNADTQGAKIGLCLRTQADAPTDFADLAEGGQRKATMMPDHSRQKMSLSYSPQSFFNKSPKHKDLEGSTSTSTGLPLEKAVFIVMFGGADKVSALDNFVVQAVLYYWVEFSSPVNPSAS